MSNLSDEISRRRTFAIISHPDAGKTTLTEKLLLFGGAIQLAGEVKARGERRRVRSDWMAVERERGISVSSAVMSFEHQGLAFNLLDTPGHQDFSEDTYRTLTAVDSAVMVLDAAKGIEEQTRKLFEVCRLRDVPIITFVNKLDREARDPFDLLDEIEQALALDVTPASWPIGMGRDFLGTYDLFADALLLFERGLHDRVTEPIRCSGLDDPKLPRLLPKEALAKLREEVEMAKGLCPPLRRAGLSRGPSDAGLFRQRAQQFRGARIIGRGRRIGPGAAAAAGRPSADLARGARGRRFRLQGAGQYRPAAPRPHRLCADRLGPLPARHEIEEHPHRAPVMSVQAPVFFLARERNLAEEAWPGDIIGIPNHGSLQDRRHLDRGRGGPHHRHPEFRAGDTASGSRSRTR